MKNSISICIPTYKRASFLRKTLLSIIEADFKPLEIIIGDNSGGDIETENVISDFELILPIRYIVHNPPMNYGGNLKTISAAAKGNWISVIHDDDFYLPNFWKLFRIAIQQNDFDFFFSDHLICSSDGTLLNNESNENSVKYNRNLLKRGCLDDPLSAVLLSQVCMDGWIAKRELVQSVEIDLRWPEYVDTQYLVQFASLSKKWFYETEPTFVYRLSAVSLTVSGIKVQELFEYYNNLHLGKKEHIEIRNRILVEYAPVAVSRWLRVGQKDKARKCLHSQYYLFPKTIRGFVKYIVQIHLLYFPGLNYVFNHLK